MGHPPEVLRKIAVDRKHGRKETGDGSDIEPQSRFAKNAELATERHFSVTGMDGKREECP